MPTRRTARMVAAGLIAALVAPAMAANGTPAPGSTPMLGGQLVQAERLLVSTGGSAHALARRAAAHGAVVHATHAALRTVVVSGPAPALQAVLNDPQTLGARQDSTVTVATSGSGEGHSRPAPTRNVYRETINSAPVAHVSEGGRGVTVALIDTGISPVADLSAAVRQVRGLDGTVADCVNFTDEPHCSDSYGHGTFLAGLIAGSGEGNATATGVAPHSKLINIKLAGRTGAADASALLAALQWVVAHKRTYDIGVLNLSLGTPSGNSWKTDPLNYAVQRAVDAGIVVVVAAGNTGPDPRTVTKPGDDPLVLTVAATDDVGTVDDADDSVPAFSAAGPTLADGLAKPDVAAPGARLISLRSPGSAVEHAVPGGLDENYRRGSGTSMSTAVVTGAAALLRAARPDWTPAQVKAALMSTATAVPSAGPDRVGRGTIDVSAAAASSPSATASSSRSNGQASLDKTRGAWALAAGGAALTGSRTAQNKSFDNSAYVNKGWTADTWGSSVFAGANWQATNWQATNWQGTNWQGSTSDPYAFYGTNWQGSASYGAWE